MQLSEAKEERRKIVTVKDKSPSIYFTSHAMATMNGYIDQSVGEISGIGRVELLGDEGFLVSEIRLIAQVNSCVSTELDEEALSDFLVELVERGHDPSAWKLWWHKHPFGVFWSGTDEATCLRFANKWMLSVVANPQREYLGRIDVYSPIHLAQELPVRVYTRLKDEEIAAIKEEINRKVRRKTWSFGWWHPDVREEGQRTLWSRERGEGEEEENPWTF